MRGLREGDRVAFLSYHAYAEYDIAPRPARCCVLPRELGRPAVPRRAARLRDEHLPPQRRSRAGQTVAIVGIGFLGALLTQLARRAGARVIAHLAPPVRARARPALGAAETIALDDHSGAVVARPMS